MNPAGLLLSGVVVAMALGVPATAHAADSQTQTCPIMGADPDTVTLTGPPTLSPPNHMLANYGITSSETPIEMGDPLPHGVTISFTITTIDTPGGSSSNSTDSVPPSGNTSGDFSITAPFQLRAELPGSARTYQIDWAASFDGINGMSVHTCSSTDGIHQPFRVSVVSPGSALPDAPLAAMLPVAGGLVLSGWLARRRRAIGLDPKPRR
jgi:hypothetical protein